MKLYDKKFLIYENCMIRSFGQHGEFFLLSFVSKYLFFSQYEIKLSTG